MASGLRKIEICPDNLPANGCVESDVTFREADKGVEQSL
jgi:hypothetical protein